MKQLDGLFVGSSIRDLMREHRLSPLEFSKRIKVMHDTVQALLDGRSNGSLKTLIKIANTFKVSLDWLCSNR